MSVNPQSLAERIILDHANGSCYLKVPQIAIILGESPQTIYNHHSIGELPIFPIANSRILKFQVDDVITLIESSRTGNLFKR